MQAEAARVTIALIFEKGNLKGLSLRKANVAKANLRTFHPKLIFGWLIFGWNLPARSS